MVLALVLALVGSTAMAVLHLQRNISSAPLRAAEQPVRQSTQDLNVLLLGSDARNPSSSAFGTDNGSRRSDAMVLAHIAAHDARIDAVQIPRDTLLELPACADTGEGSYPGGYAMINSALNYGPACSVAAVEELSGVRIDHFIEMDFEGFITIVDALNGLPVCLPEALKDPKAKLDLPAGEQIVDGTEALALARTRYAVGDGSDIARLSHQQMVMSAIVEHVSSREVLTRPDRLYGFLDAATSAVTVDTELDSISSLASLASRLAQVPSDQISFQTMPWNPAPGNPNRVVPADDAATIFGNLQTDTPMSSGPSDETGSQSEPVRSVPVQVTNSAGINGIAAEFSALATTEGYTVSGIGTGPAQESQTSLLIENTEEARKTAQSLITDLELDLVPRADEVTGVHLVLGQDINQIAAPGPQPTPAQPTTRDGVDIDRETPALANDLCSAQ